jgi:hypothetical protein
VRHIPFDADSARARQRRQDAKRLRDDYWVAYRERRDRTRAMVVGRAVNSVDQLGDAELIRIGAVMYWCEGSKCKPWRPGNERVVFTNSDPGLIRLFLRFLAAVDVPPERVTFRVAIHESADAERAVEWWADVVGVPGAVFRPPTVKRHSANTNRHNTGDGYHGCVIDVARSRELYWFIEGIVSGLVAAGGTGPEGSPSSAIATVG